MGVASSSNFVAGFIRIKIRSIGPKGISFLNAERLLYSDVVYEQNGSLTVSLVSTRLIFTNAANDKIFVSVWKIMWL